MFKKLGPMLALGAALTMLVPGPVQARGRDEEREHHHHRFNLYFGVGPGYYTNGYYDQWGYFHPYYRGPYGPGYYDAWGYWRPY